MQGLQQIRVRIEAEYPEDLSGSLPRVQRLLSGVDNRLIDQSWPLIELVPVLVRLSQDDERDAGLLGKINQHLPQLKVLAKQAEEAIGEWRLSQAQTALDQMGEVFSALEQELDD